MFEARLARGSAVGAGSVALSVGVHALIIALAVAGTAVSMSVDSGSEGTRIQYFPPPNPVGVTAAPEELHYVEVAAPDMKAGFEYHEFTKPAAGVQRGVPNDAKQLLTVVPLGNDDVSLAEAARRDSAFTEIEVDLSVMRLPGSAAPVYPPELRKEGVEGYVLARYVVDTNGFADSTSLVIVTATRQEFVEAIKHALPGMRFSAATIGERHVRQLVEQPFSFRIERP